MTGLKFKNAKRVLIKKSSYKKKFITFFYKKLFLLKKTHLLDKYCVTLTDGLKNIVGWPINVLSQIMILRKISQDDLYRIGKFICRWQTLFFRAIDMKLKCILRIENLSYSSITKYVKEIVMICNHYIYSIIFTMICAIMILMI